MNVGLLSFLGKSILIALCAGMASWFYLILLASFYPTWEMDGEALGGTFFYTALGSLVIGLPIALLTFWMSRRHLVKSPTTLAMIAVLAGIMMVLASFVIGDRNGVIVLGIPAFVSACTFGLLGWFWIVRPMRGEGVHG